MVPSQSPLKHERRCSSLFGYVFRHVCVCRLGKRSGYFVCLRMWFELPSFRRGCAVSDRRSSMSWMTSRTVLLPSAAARLPTTSPRWCPITSLK